jgi:CTP synthase
MFCNVKPDCVLNNVTQKSIYDVPVMLEEQNFSSIVCREMNIEAEEIDLTGWNAMLERIHHLSRTVRIALVGKYVRLHDAYLSVKEALLHGGYENDARVEIVWVEAETITEQTAPEIFSGIDGIIVPGGFGSRGIEGMIESARYARTHDIPYLGICLGMQIGVIEFARNVLGYKDANSGEFDEQTEHKVIDFMPDQNNEIEKGGTMRLGAYPCNIAAGSRLESCYHKDSISERHRHRYEFNNAYRKETEENGMRIAGTSPDQTLVEAVELPDHRFFIGVQYHPEFKSRPNKAHPLFREFIKASLPHAE